MATSKIAKTVEKIAGEVTAAFRKVEDTVTAAYFRIEDRFLDRYLTREGETVEEARKRLKAEPKK